MSDINVEIKSGGEITTEIQDNRSYINTTIVGSGPRGIQGEQGDNAYEYWLSLGNTGTFDEFMNSYHTMSADDITETDTRVFVSPTDRESIAGYVHDQMASSDIWVIHHPLDKYPSVLVTDTGGNVVVGDIDYVSRDLLVVTFSAEFSGTARLS
jgi:hypothetical protein